MEILELKNSEPNNPFAPKQDTIFLCEDQLDIDTDSLKKIILIMFWSFKSYDLVHYLITQLDSLTGEKNLENFLNQNIKIEKKY